MISGRVATLGLLILVDVITACNKDKTSASPDSSSLTAATTPASHTTTGNTGWDNASAGSVMLLRSGDDPLTAAIVLPHETDSTLSNLRTFELDSLSSLPVDLFGPGGSAGQSNLSVTSQRPASEGCLTWPIARLTTKPAAAWKVGFTRGKALPLAIDSIEAMSAADSSLITTELARVASATTVRDDVAFQGLPFIVTKAYRFAYGKNSVIAGIVVRKINEEANPREEHLLLIAERSDNTGHYVASFQSRTAGTEDAIRTSAVLAAVRFIQIDRPALVVSFEYDNGGQAALVERIADHNWRITWRSAYTGC